MAPCCLNAKREWDDIDEATVLALANESENYSQAVPECHVSTSCVHHILMLHVPKSADQKLQFVFPAACPSFASAPSGPYPCLAHRSATLPRLARPLPMQAPSSAPHCGYALDHFWFVFSSIKSNVIAFQCLPNLFAIPSLSTTTGPVWACF